MPKNATELMESLGEEGAMKGLSVKVTPEQKALIADLQKKTSMRPSEIVQKALDHFFDGYEASDDE